MTVEQRMERFTEAEALDLAATVQAERARSAGLGIGPWAPGERDHFIKIATEKAIGRRIPRHPDDGFGE